MTIVLGELTRVYYRLAAEAASRCIQCARLVIAPGQRHMSPGRDPDRFTSSIRQFVAANP